jgi:hypothetical protein
LQAFFKLRCFFFHSPLSLIFFTLSRRQNLPFTLEPPTTNRCFPFSLSLKKVTSLARSNHASAARVMKNQQSSKMYSMQKSYSFKEEKFRSTIKRSHTAADIEKNHCFKPTDRFDPGKKSFLVDLSKKIWSKTVVTSEKNARVTLLINLRTRLFCVFVGGKTRGKEADRLSEDFHASQRCR